jgi:hypothetical protein
MAHNEGHFLGRTQACCHDEVALIFTVIIIGHHNDLTSGEGFEAWHDWLATQLNSVQTTPALIHA